MGIEFVIELTKSENSKELSRLDSSKESKKDISTRISEIEEAVKTIKDSKNDKDVKTGKDKFEPVIEQYDLNSTSNDSYSADAGYTSSDFDSSKYYDSLKEESETFSSASYDHKLFQEAYKLAQETKNSNETGKGMSNINLIVDGNARDTRIAMKTYSEVVWRWMYDGKLVYN